MQSDQVGYWICNAVFCIVIPLLIRNPAWLSRVTEWARDRLADLDTRPAADEPDADLSADLSLARLGRQAERLQRRLADERRSPGMRQRANHLAYERVLADLRSRPDGWRVSPEVSARRASTTGWVTETIDVRWR